MARFRKVTGCMLGMFKAPTSQLAPVHGLAGAGPVHRCAQALQLARRAHRLGAALRRRGQVRAAAGPRAPRRGGFPGHGGAAPQYGPASTRWAVLHALRGAASCLLAGMDVSRRAAAQEDAEHETCLPHCLPSFLASVGDHRQADVTKTSWSARCRHPLTSHLRWMQAHVERGHERSAARCSRTQTLRCMHLHAPSHNLQ